MGSSEGTARPVGLVAAVALLVPAITLLLIGAPPASAAAVATCPAAPIGPATTVDVDGAGFVPIAPQRIADSRGAPGSAPTVGAGCALRVDLAPASPPPDAVAVAITITADHAAAIGFITAYGCASPRTNTSVLNPNPTLPAPNLAIVPIDASGQVCLFTERATDLIVDVTGWFVTDEDPFHEMTPVRALDTRANPTPVAKGTTLRVQLGDIYVPGTATAAAVTVTITQAAEGGWITAYPCGSPQPATSISNVLPGRDRGVSALIGLGGGGLCIYTDITTHLLVDVNGWFGPDQAGALPGARLIKVESTRVADSRSGPGEIGTLAGGGARRYSLASLIPPGTASASLNVTAVDPQAAGYLTIYPCGAVPNASAVNYAANTNETTLVTIALSADAEVCVYSSATTHLVLDLFAVFGFPTSFRQLTATPPLDREAAPGQLDHTIRCPKGGGQITVTATATAGERVSVNGLPAATTGSWTGLVQEDGLIPLTLSGPGTHSEQHFIRCLPFDFPVLAAQGASPTPGWYVANSMGSPEFPSSPGYAFILDEYGVPIWYKRMPYRSVGTFTDDVGGLAYRKWTGKGYPNAELEPIPLGIELRALDGTLTGIVGVPGERTGWHEMLTLPNGNRLVTVYRDRPLDPGPAPQCRSFENPGTIVTAELLVDSVIVELDPGNNVVWDWSSEDHILPAETVVPQCFEVNGNQELDLVHINALDVFPDGDILVTARHTSSVYRIDKATEMVEWKLGGSSSTTGTSLTLVGDSMNGPSGPHDGRVLPNGNITMHDSHINPPGTPSRAVEYAVDPKAETATLVWSYQSVLNASTTLGSVRRQPDGNTLIGWGASWQPWLEEVDPDGHAVLVIRPSAFTNFYRVVKLPESTYDRDNLRLLAGGSMPAAP